MVGGGLDTTDAKKGINQAIDYMSNREKQIWRQAGMEDEIPPEDGGGGSGGNGSGGSGGSDSGAAGGPGGGGAGAGANGTVPPRRDPLALDLDGDGLETTTPNDKVVVFDHNNDGI
jgi:hypothetical protein